MTNRNDEIQRANRKALPKFLLILVLAWLAGGVLGFCAAAFGLDAMAGALTAAGAAFSRRAAPVLQVVCVLLELAICLPLILSARRQAAAWDGEDEAVHSRVEGRLNVLLWVSSLILICSMFLMAASYAAGMDGSAAPIFLSIGCFAAVMLESVLFQQKAVDLCKRLSPEKRGSVYDLRFKKKWLDSCDEAERSLIGQCAYRAYSAMQTVCLVLWMIFTLSALFLDTGFLPVLAVCVIWAAGLSAYCFWTIKLSRPGAALSENPVGFSDKEDAACSAHTQARTLRKPR